MPDRALPDALAEEVKRLGPADIMVGTALRSHRRLVPEALPEPAPDSEDAPADEDGDPA